jgi:hypothetical protein
VAPSADSIVGERASADDNVGGKFAIFPAML